MAELTDAQDLGSCGVIPVEVQVLSSGLAFFKNPPNTAKTLIIIGCFEIRCEAD